MKKHIIQSNLKKLIGLSVSITLASCVMSSCNQSINQDLRDRDELSDDLFDDETPSVPANISGAFLTYESASVRCAQKSTNDVEHKLSCAVASKGDDGIEFRSTEVEKGLEISWDDTVKVINGSSLGQTCVISDDKLSMECDITTNGKIAKIEVAATFSKGSKSKTEKEEIILPYSVGVSAGFMPLFPYNFTAKTEDVLSLNGDTTETKKQQFGFSPYLINKDLITDYTGACFIDGEIYLKNDHLVYKIQEDGALIELGNKDAYTVSDRYTITQDPLKLLGVFETGFDYCFKDKIMGFSGPNTFTYDPKSKLIEYYPKAGLFVKEKDRVLLDGKDRVIVYSEEPDSEGYYNLQIYKETQAGYEQNGPQIGSNMKIKAISNLLGGGFVYVLEDDSINLLSVIQNEEGGSNISLGKIYDGLGVIPGYGNYIFPNFAIQLSSKKYLIAASYDKLIVEVTVGVDEQGDETYSYKVVVSEAEALSDINLPLGNVKSLTRISDTEIIVTLSDAVYRVDLDKKTTSLIAGGAKNDFQAPVKAEDARLLSVEDLLYLDDGSVLIAAGLQDMVLHLKDGFITRFAGDPNGVLNLNESDPSKIKLSYPSSITKSPSGDIFIASRNDHVIWKISKSGEASIIAGTGNEENYDTFVSESPATSVDLFYPHDLTYDYDEDVLYFAQYSAATGSDGGGIRYVKDNKIFSLTSTNYYDPRIQIAAGSNISNFYGSPYSLNYTGNGVLTIASEGTLAAAKGGFMDIDLESGLVTKIFGKFAVSDTNTDEYEDISPGYFVRLNERIIYTISRSYNKYGLTKIDREGFGDSKMSVIFGDYGGSSLSCGEGEVKGDTTSEKSDYALKMSLRHICSGGSLNAIDSKSSCETTGTYKLIFSQKFSGGSDTNGYAHIIETEVPCGNDIGGSN